MYQQNKDNSWMQFIVVANGDTVLYYYSYVPTEQRQFLVIIIREPFHFLLSLSEIQFYTTMIYGSKQYLW